MFEGNALICSWNCFARFDDTVLDGNGERLVRACAEKAVEMPLAMHLLSCEVAGTYSGEH